MSAITDRARDFWDRISARERNLVVLLAIATPLVLAFLLGSAIRDGLDSMEHRNDRTRKALLAVETMHAKGETKPTTDDALAAMTTDPLSLPTYITNAAQQAKYTLTSSISSPRSQSKGGFVTSSASLSVDKLDIEQLKDFLGALEGDSKVVAITKLEIDRDFREKEKLRAEIEVSTYSREAKSGSDAGSAATGTKGSN